MVCHALDCGFALPNYPWYVPESLEAQCHTVSMLNPSAPVPPLSQLSVQPPASMRSVQLATSSFQGQRKQSKTCFNQITQHIKLTCNLGHQEMPMQMRKRLQKKPRSPIISSRTGLGLWYPNTVLNRVDITLILCMCGTARFDAVR